MLVFAYRYVNVIVILIHEVFGILITDVLDNAFVRSYDVTIVDNAVVERRAHMAIKRTARTSARRQPLQTLMSILGDVAQVTGIGIRYF